MREVGIIMKKRILSSLIALILLFSVVMNTNVKTAVAAEDNTQNAVSPYSSWAMNDLVVGDTYGIYPKTWYSYDMTAPISRSQFMILISEVRKKILKTNDVTKNVDNIYRLDNNMSVKTILNNFYTMLSGFEFSEEIGMKDKTAVKFMTDNGIFTGTNGELALSDTCSIEQACIFATRIVTSVYNKLDAASKGFLWEAKKGENTVYMLGSIHIADTSIYPFNKKILDAYQSSDSLAVELNAYDLTGAYAMMALGIYSDGSTLKDHVSAKTYQETIDLAAKYGYAESDIAMCKPWYVYTMFAALASTDSGDVEEAQEAAGLGIDLNFTVNALLSGKPILEVEGYEYQGQILDSFSDDLEEFLLSSTIESINDITAGTSEEGAENLDMALKAWHDGDVETFMSLMSVDEEYPEIFNADATAIKALSDEFTLKLITQRDARMANYIDKLLSAEGSSTTFVIVGSAHYISDHSVLDILKEKGYEITQIK